MRFWPYLILRKDIVRTGVPVSYRSLPTHPCFPSSLADVVAERWSSSASSRGGHPWLVVPGASEALDPGLGTAMLQPEPL